MSLISAAAHETSDLSLSRKKEGGFGSSRRLSSGYQQRQKRKEKKRENTTGTPVSAPFPGPGGLQELSHPRKKRTTIEPSLVDLWDVLLTPKRERRGIGSCTSGLYGTAVVRPPSSSCSPRESVPSLALSLSLYLSRSSRPCTPSALLSRQNTRRLLLVECLFSNPRIFPIYIPKPLCPVLRSLTSRALGEKSP
jgi:hypothetical protein